MSRPNRPCRPACALVLASAVLQAGCASMCKEMAADRRAFFARRAPRSPVPHATIVVPFAVADRLIARRLGALEPIGSPVELPGRIGTFLGSIRLVPRRLTLRPARDDRLGLRLELEVVAGDASLLALALDLDLRPEVDPARGALRVAVRADDLRSVRPSIAADTADRLATAIRSRLPSVAQAVISREEIAALSRAAIDHLAGRLGALVIDSGLLSSLGEITRLGVEIPMVPVSHISLRSVGKREGGALLVEVFTQLPAAAGVRATGVRDPGARTVEVRLSADALAELANRALATGQLPRRYDEKMRPKKDGEFTPGIRWVAGPRPFKIVAWRVASPCLRARIGADPVVTVPGGKLVVGIEHGEVEEVRGAMLVRARVWLKRLGADAIRFSKETLSSARISIAGTPVTGTIERAFYRDGEFGIDLTAE